MKRLLKYLKGYRTETALGPLFKLCEATLELIVPLVIAGIVDNGITPGNTSYIVWMSLLLVLFGIVGLAFSVTAQYFSAKAAVGFSSRIREALFGKIQSLSYTDIDTLGTSTMITRTSLDTNKVQNGLNLTLRLLLRSPFVVFGAMIMAFIVDKRSSLIFLALIGALAIVVFGIMLITMPLYRRVQRHTDGVLGKTRENLSGARVIRAFCREDAEINEFARRNDALTRTQKTVGRISALMNPLTYVIVNVCILWLIHTGAVEVNSGNLSTGAVLALYNYMSQILVELIKLANLIISITRALASAERIADTLDMESTEIGGTLKEGVGSPFAVEFKNAGLTYAGAGAPSLTGITFSARAGETVGIIGGTGSGKSSLVNLIPAFYTPTEGEVLIDGSPEADYEASALREMIGVVPQRTVLFRGTVRDNIKWGAPDATDDEIYSALEIARAREIVDKKDGLDTKIEEGAANLSGGQKQLLAIARAVVGRPKILILDDSASALDYATDAALRKSLKDAGGDATVFIVSQRTSSVMHADRIIVLEDGEAVGIGTHDELLSDCRVYREIYSSQFGDIPKEGGEANG